MTTPEQPKRKSLQEQQQEELAEKRRKESEKIEPKVEGVSNLDRLTNGIKELELTKQQKALERQCNSYEEWEDGIKRQQDELNKKAEDLATLEKSIKEREVTISGKEFNVDADTKKNQEWATKLERAEKGLKSQVADFLALKGKDREILRVEIEKLLKYLCIPMVVNSYGDGYTLDCVDNIVVNSIKIASSILEQRCKIKPLYNTDGSYLDSEARKRQGFKEDGSKYQNWESENGKD